VDEAEVEAEVGPGPTRLVLPVPEVAARVPRAHVVLLDPFMAADRVDEGVVEELRHLFADVVPFPYVLGEPTRFPAGGAYLPPRPVSAFRSIIGALRRAFPETAARTRPFDTEVPHLALPEDALGAVTGPVEAHAREAALLAPDGTVLATFRFGTSAA
jgi:hypothetical protein